MMKYFPRTPHLIYETFEHPPLPESYYVDLSCHMNNNNNIINKSI